MRFQALMPDVLHWLGIQKIDNMVSMSDMYVLSVLSSKTHGILLAIQRRLPHSDGMFPFPVQWHVCPIFRCQEDAKSLG